MNEINNILYQLNTFNDIYSLIINKNDKFKGQFLEVFAKYFFKIHYLYKNDIKQVYLYDEIPIKIKKELSLPNKDKVSIY